MCKTSLLYVMFFILYVTIFSFCNVYILRDWKTCYYLQVEEIEALNAIYPGELTVIDEVSRTYCITVKSQRHTSTGSIPLQVSSIYVFV